MRTTKNDVAVGENPDGFSVEERAAMKERAQELKAAARGYKNKADGERDVLAKIEEMSEPDRSMARRLHEMIKETTPSLTARTWYGMPAYAREDKVVLFFQSGLKFKTRYSTLGFSDAACLDDGDIWPASFALKEWTPEVQARVATLVKKAMG